MVSWKFRPGDHDFFFNIIPTREILGQLQGKFHNRFQERQTPPSNSLQLIEFETLYIKPNSPLFFRQQNMQWSCNMVNSYLILCLRAHA